MSVLFFVFVHIALSMADLRQMREGIRNAVPDIASDRDNLYGLYRSSLSLENGKFLPLCGNGMIDNKQTYIDWYKKNPSMEYPWKNFTLKLIVDEVCDDGNRMDGDGCSADCLDFDTYTEPCILKTNLGENEVIQGIFMDNSVGDLYAFTSKNRAGLLKTNSLDGIDFDWYFYFESFIMDMVLSRDGFLHLVTSDAVWYRCNKASGIQRLKSLSFQDGYERVSMNVKLVLLEDDQVEKHGKIMAIVKTRYVVKVFNDVNERYIASSQLGISVSGPFKSNYHVSFDSSQNMLYISSIFQAFRRLEINLTAGHIDIIETHPSLEVNIWYTIVLSMFNIMQFMTATSNQYALEFKGDISLLSQHLQQNLIYNTDIRLKVDGNAIRQKISCLSNAGLLEQKSMLRSLLLNDNSRVQKNMLYNIGSLKLFNSISAMTDFFNQDVYSNDTIASMLDLNIDYDFLLPMQSTNLSLGTYMDIFNEMDDLSIFSGYFQNETKKIKTRYTMNVLLDKLRNLLDPNSVSHFVQHPFQYHWYLLRKGSIYFVGKSAVLVKEEGLAKRCLPLHMMPCTRCYWFDGQSCLPCSSISATSLAWSIQCNVSSCAKNGRRLLSNTSDSLQGQFNVNVSTVLSGISYGEVLRRFSLLNFSNLKFDSVPSSGGVQVIAVNAEDTLLTLREFNYIISGYNDWTVIVPPATYYYFYPAAKNNDNGANSKIENWVLYAAIFGTLGLVFIVVLVFVFYKYCSKSRHVKFAAGTKSPFSAYEAVYRF